MKRRIFAFIVLSCWLVSGFGFCGIWENVATAAPENHLSRPQMGHDGTSVYVQATVQSASLDRDYDGLTDDVEENGWENRVGLFITDPLDPDSDDDGLTDGQEKLFDTDPLDDTSPGIYVEYGDSLKTSKYFPWERHGSKFIAFESAVVRRGSTVYVGGPADATIDIDETGSLTNLHPQWNPCTGRWAITVPSGGTVGKYKVTLEREGWNQSLNLYVIFELPTNMSDAEVAAYVYSNDPDNFRDEYAIWFMTSIDEPWDPWPPYHQTRGRGFAFQSDQYEAYVFEDHIIDAINGYTGEEGATRALGRHLDSILRFESESLKLDMWSALHSGNQQAQCSTHASAMASFARGAGIPARPVIADWDMHVMGSMLFDHSTEVWLYGRWRVMRAYRRDESSPSAPIAGGIYSPRDRDNWFYPDSQADIIAVAGPDWVWEQMQTDWGGSQEVDYFFGNYDNRSIVRWDWVETQVTHYNGWGWGREPTDIGDPYETWLPGPSSVPTPGVIVSVEGDGTVTKDPNQSSYEYGDVVTLEAFADEGWTFDGWSGDLEGTDNPETVTVTDDEDMHITATFIPNEYTLDVNVDGGGSVTRNPDQST